MVHITNEVVGRLYQSITDPLCVIEIMEAKHNGWVTIHELGSSDMATIQYCDVARKYDRILPENCVTQTFKK